jgi:UTP--glucose-1-phosphate uridylyltransferase
MNRVRKAVLPVAGLGTRFLPATKAMPKEMLPVVDRPLIQHVVDEATAAGIEHLIFVTGRNKGVIEDHFDKQVELEFTLRARNKIEIIESLRHELPPPGTTSFTRQQEPLGLGHAVWCARELVGNEPFALLLPDVLIQNEIGCLSQMVQAASQLDDDANIIAIEEAPPQHLHMYGVVGFRKRIGKLYLLNKMVEKPRPEDAPSNFIITGRYILQPGIFDALASQARGAGDEIQLTDAMIALSKTQPFYGFHFSGRSFDCGSKLGFLTANVAYALKRPDLAPDLRHALRDLLKIDAASTQSGRPADKSGHPADKNELGEELLSLQTIAEG